MTYTTTKYISKQQSERLDEIKNTIRDSYLYFEKNYKRFQEFMRFIFVSTLTTTEMTKLAALKKPPLQFNIVEALVNRQLGEYSEHEMSVTVKAAEGINIKKMPESFIQLMEVLESHLREITANNSNDDLQYKCMKDLLAGGFSVVEIYTDYVNCDSFEQNIYIEKCFNPCLAFFDPKARLSHKGDGKFCGKIVPMERYEIVERWGEKIAQNIKFMTYENFEGFNWSYKNGNKEIALIAEYFEKITKKKIIVKLADTDVIHNQQIKDILKNNDVELKGVMDKEDYQEMIKIWPMLFPYTIPPIIVDERKTSFDTIEKTILCETQIIEHTKTDFEILPLIFIDGNSVEVQMYDSMGYEQVTRPSVYQAKGIQKLKDFAGQTQAAEIENMMQSKLMAAIESVPSEPDYQAAYKNYQQASTVLYNAFKDNNPNAPLPPPREIQRTPTPPIVGETFMIADKMIQNIMGSYDAELGVRNNAISGTAIEKGATQSSASARAAHKGMERGFTRLCEGIVNLIPKYYVTPRTIPVVYQDGKRDYAMINDEQDPESIMMHYSSKDLKVQVEIAPSSGLQKQIALEQMINLMKINPIFNKFISEVGAEILLSQCDFAGRDRVVAAYTGWYDQEKVKQEQQMQQQQQVMQQMQMLEAAEKQANIQLLNAQAMAAQSLAQSKQGELMLKTNQQENQKNLETAEFIRDTRNQSIELQQNASKIAIAGQEANIDEVLAVAKIKQEQIDSILRAEEVAAEKQRTAVEGAISVSSHLHEIKVDRHNMAKEMMADVKE